MRSSSPADRHHPIAAGAMVALLPLMACSDLAAPAGPAPSPAREIARAEIVMTPKRPMADYPIRLRLTGKPIDGATYRWSFADGTTVGGSFTCGVALDDRAYCWGSNQLGTLGLGDTVDRLVPTVVPGLRF